MDSIDHIIADNRADNQTREIINAVGNANVWRDRYINLFKRYNALREQHCHEVEEAIAEALTFRDLARQLDNYKELHVDDMLDKARAEAHERANTIYEEYLDKDYRPTMKALNIPID